jgi:hypothetical protein
MSPFSRAHLVNTNGEETSNDGGVTCLVETEPACIAHAHAEHGGAAPQRGFVPLHSRRRASSPISPPACSSPTSDTIQRVGGVAFMEYMATRRRLRRRTSFTVSPLTSYNAVTPLEVEASRRLLASLQGFARRNRLEQVLWAASGSEAVKRPLGRARKRPQARRHHSRHTTRLSRQEGSRRRRNRQRATPSAIPASVSSASRARNATPSKRREPLDLAPYRAELKAASRRIRRPNLLPHHRTLSRRRRFVSSAEGVLQLLQQLLPRERSLVHPRRSAGQLRPHRLALRLREYGIEPDMVVLGKGMGNGIPVDAVVGRADCSTSFTTAKSPTPGAATLSGAPPS